MRSINISILSVLLTHQQGGTSAHSLNNLQPGSDVNTRPSDSVLPILFSWPLSHSTVVVVEEEGVGRGGVSIEVTQYSTTLMQQNAGRTIKFGAYLHHLFHLNPIQNFCFLLLLPVTL